MAKSYARHVYQEINPTVLLLGKCAQHRAYPKESIIYLGLRMALYDLSVYIALPNEKIYSYTLWVWERCIWILLWVLFRYYTMVFFTTTTEEDFNQNAFGKFLMTYVDLKTFFFTMYRWTTILDKFGVKVLSTKQFAIVFFSFVFFRSQSQCTLSPTSKVVRSCSQKMRER